MAFRSVAGPLAAVSFTNPNYESLPAVQSSTPLEAVLSARRTPSARIVQGRPDQAVPAGQNRKIPTTTQQPASRGTNQRIPYARMMFVQQTDRTAPRELKDGDILFVHRMSNATGSGPSRTIKCTGVSQLNNMLRENIPGGTTLDYDGDPGLVERVRDARIAYWEDMRRAADAHGDASEQARAAANLAVARTIIPSINDVQPETDWAGVRLLSEWTLDGVLISTDDAVDVDDTNMPKLSRDDGVLLNVCIQGPTPLRNTRWEAQNTREGHEYVTQFIDESPLVLDKVFVGIFAETERSPATGDLLRLRFKLIPFTGRQMHVMNLKRMRPGDLSLLVPAPFAHGPSEEQFRRCVGAWRVGSLMDSRLTRGVESYTTVNVCVEWWPLSKLRAHYDDEGGLSQVGREVELSVATPIVVVVPSQPKVAKAKIVAQTLPFLQALAPSVSERVTRLKEIEAVVLEVADELGYVPNKQDDASVFVVRKFTAWMIGTGPDALDATAWQKKLWDVSYSDKLKWAVDNFSTEEITRALEDVQRAEENQASVNLASVEGYEQSFEEARELSRLVEFLDDIATVLLELDPTRGYYNALSALGYELDD
jgi:hypothetical protein